MVVWAGFWILFVAGSATGGGMGGKIPAGEILEGILVAAIFLAWRRPLVAGIIFLINAASPSRRRAR